MPYKTACDSGTLSSMPSCLSGSTHTPSDLDGCISTRQASPPIVQKDIERSALAMQAESCGQLGPRHTGGICPMCLVARGARSETAGFPLWSWANRDEFLIAPSRSSRLVGSQRPAELPILGGRDLQCRRHVGWSLNCGGRLGLLTQCT